MKKNELNFGTKSCLTKISEYFNKLADECCEVINVKKFDVIVSPDDFGIEVVFVTEYKDDCISVEGSRTRVKNENFDEAAVNGMIDKVTEFFKEKVTEEVAAELGIVSLLVHNSSWSTGNFANVTVSANF